MDIIKLLFILVCAFNLPNISSGSFLQKHWNETRTVCGYNITELSGSMKAELLKSPTTRKQNKSSDTIMITYKDFSCCLKKSGVVSLGLEEERLNCMQGLLKCINDVEKTPCSFDPEYFLIKTFSIPYVIVVCVVAGNAILWTIIFIYRSHQDTIEFIQQRGIREPRQTHDYRWMSLLMYY